MQKASEAKSPIINEARQASSDEAAAVEFWERYRWNGEPACVHCGDTNVYQMQAADGSGRDQRFRWRCHGCKKQFTVKVGTVLEDSKLPYRVWTLALWLLCAGKKGCAAKQLQRMAGISYKSALFLTHRLRYAMSDEPGTLMTGTVEVDETYIGGKPRANDPEPRKRGRGTSKRPVVALVERGGKVVASPVASVTSATLESALVECVHPSACIMTDELNVYPRAAQGFAAHKTVSHGKDEYVRYEEDGFVAHTNTAEGFFSLLKRGINGVYHSVSPRHLWRYCDEFAFRYTYRGINDGERMVTVIRRVEGKKLPNRHSAAL